MARGRHPTRIHISPPEEHVAAKYLRQWCGRDLHCEPHRFPALTSPDLFGNDRPLEIDFGCGTGVLACTRARQFPHVNFVGIDLSQKPIYCAIREAAVSNLENIMFIRANFNTMLPLLRPQTVSTAYYLLPNPPEDYKNERANTRRRDFLRSLYNALASGGRFFFATDSDAFFECIRNILNRDLGYEPLTIENTDISSEYWRHWEEHGRNVKSLVVEKSVK
jgi:tRNA (guanine-N7-)-methyltransferase